MARVNPDPAHRLKNRPDGRFFALGKNPRLISKREGEKPHRGRAEQRAAMNGHRSPRRGEPRRGESFLPHNPIERDSTIWISLGFSFLEKRKGRCHYHAELPAEQPKRERLHPHSASPIPQPVRLHTSDQTLIVFETLSRQFWPAYANNDCPLLTG